MVGEVQCGEGEAILIKGKPPRGVSVPSLEDVTTITTGGFGINQITCHNSGSGYARDRIALPFGGRTSELARPPKGRVGCPLHRKLLPEGNHIVYLSRFMACGTCCQAGEAGPPRGQ